MIEGFRLKVPSSELARHCVERAKYHRAKAREHYEELVKLHEESHKIIQEKRPQDAETVEQTMNWHANKAKTFDFYSTHLHSEDYSLDEDDIETLGFINYRTPVRREC